MIREIIKIDGEKCNACGICVEACHEGAIGIVKGKARLLRDDYCDGLGNCLPVCPLGAISFEEREAAAFDEEAVRQMSAGGGKVQWPVQIKLAPKNAPFFKDAHLLIAADCAAYASVEFHSRFMKDKTVLIGCPRLDNTDYSEKLQEIISANSIRSITAVRMEVPCCGGIEHAVNVALKNSGKSLPCQIYTLSTGGKLLEG